MEAAQFVVSDVAATLWELVRERHGFARFTTVAASAVRCWFAVNPRRLAAVGGTGGLAMIGVGVSVAVAGRHS